MSRRRIPAELALAPLTLGTDGYARADADGRTALVKNALPGERVTARVLRKKKGELLTEAHQLEAGENAGPSPERVPAACEYFPRCGGCVMQHMDYPRQMALKQRHLLEQLEQHDVVPGRLRPPSTGPRLHYRTKARLGVRIVGGEPLVGFRESFSNRVGRMSDCKTLVAGFAELLPALKRLVGGMACRERLPQIELAAGDHGRAMIVRHLDPLVKADADALEAFGHRHGVFMLSQEGGPDTVCTLDGSPVPLLGYGNADFGLYLEFHPADFTQVNLAVNRMLVRAAVDALAVEAGTPVTDLFCGIGNFSLALAARGARVTGLEASVGSIERAQANARLNRLEARCEFAVADLYDPDCPLPGDADALLLDPPRSGAGPNLAGWLDQARPKRIVYVSCDPASFALDAKVCGDAGYQLQEAGIYDMFPHTAHVETLGVFARLW